MTNHELPELPYDYEDLEPAIDQKTMKIHHRRHHQGYVDKLNKALEKHDNHVAHQDFSELELDELLMNIKKVPKDIRRDVRQNGGGHANHSLFWKVLTPGGSTPEGRIKEEIEEEFGSIKEFKKDLKKAATGQFGSGWAWLVVRNGDLEIKSTPNQDSPYMKGQIPIFGIDVWEHAYYLNYQNERGSYVDNVLDLINWEQVNKNYERAVRNF